MIFEMLTKKAMTILCLSTSYNLIVQFLSCYLNTHKFNTSNGTPYIVEKFQKFIPLFEAIVITGMFWYGQHYLKIPLEHLLIGVSIIMICETLLREIKLKRFSLKMITMDVCFNLISVFGTYFIFSKIEI